MWYLEITPFLLNLNSHKDWVLDSEKFQIFWDSSVKKYATSIIPKT